MDKELKHKLAYAEFKKTKICFKKTQNEKLRLKKNGKLVCYPSYSVKDLKLGLFSPLPLLSGNYEFCVDTETHNSFQKSKLSKSTNFFQACCQVHYLCKVKTEISIKDMEGKKKIVESIKIHYTAGSGILVKKGNDAYKVVTALHLFQICKSKNVVEKLIFATFDDTNFYADFVFDSKKKTALTDKNYFTKDYFDKKFECNSIELTIDEDFLAKRREWLETNKKNVNEHLDPIFSLQPPCVDLIVLNVLKPNEESDLNFQNKINSLNPLSIPRKAQLDLKKSENVALVAFNPESWINFESKDYSETIDFPKNRLQNQFSSTVFVDSLYLSVSAGVIVGFSKNFIVYQASSIDGSSGGPIVDFDGNLLGFGFFYYQDVTTASKKPAKNPTDLEFEIVVKDSKINYVCSKNANLAVSISHPVIQSYFHQDLVTTNLILKSNTKTDLRIFANSTLALLSSSKEGDKDLNQLDNDREKFEEEKVFDTLIEENEIKDYFYDKKIFEEHKIFDSLIEDRENKDKFQSLNKNSTSSDVKIKRRIQKAIDSRKILRKTERAATKKKVYQKKNSKPKTSKIKKVNKKISKKR